MISELLVGLNILEKIGKFLNWVRGRQNVKIESIASRFVRLFESHGVHRNQIPRFFGHGLTLMDIQNDASLLPKLDELLLDSACEMFAVRREWLDGAESQIHPCHDFYKQPEKFAEFMTALMAKNPEAILQGALIAPENRDPIDALLVLQAEVSRF